MSVKTNAIRDQLADLDARIKAAEAAHEKAKDTFSRFEGSTSHPMWEKLRDEVDHSRTHLRVLTAVWYRTQADLLDQMTKDGE